MKKGRIGQMIKQEENNATDKNFETLEMSIQHRQINIVQEIENILDEFGLSVKLIGYQYLKYAIEYCTLNEIKSVTSELYPMIGERFNTNYSKAERRIREAIQVILEQCDLKVIKKYFGIYKDHLTNSEFIFVIVDYIKIKMNFVEIIVKNEFEKVKKYNLTQEITDVLQELGVLAQVEGFDYLRESIQYCMFNNPELIFEEIYPAVAKKLGKTPCCVEGRMSYAIEYAFDKGDSDAFEKYFGYTINSQKGKPTNGEFVFMIADYLKIKLNIVNSFLINEQNKIFCQITQIIHEIGVPASRKGYNYLRAAIEYSINNEVSFGYNGIYRKVAKKFETTTSSVEAAIRHAIEVVWDRGNINALEKYIGYNVSKEKKPSNSILILRIADYIKNNS